MKLLLILGLMVFLLAGCVTIPKEVVELSYIVGQDLTIVHASYKKLVQEHCQFLKEQIIRFLEEKWIPAYIEDFIIEGELIENVADTEYVYLWAEVALEEIAAKKEELLEPINQEEQKLLELVDEAFVQLYNANATITAHLSSASQVRDAQDKILEIVNLKKLRDEINERLASASDQVDAAIKQLKSIL